MYTFISHSSKNFNIAEKICSVLEKNGHECFLAPRDIRSGHVYAEELVEGIDRSDAIILLLSKEANDSPHVLREIERAVSKKKTIIVYKLEEIELSKSMEYFLMTHQWINASETVGYDEVLNCVNQLSRRKERNQKEQTDTKENIPKIQKSRHIYGVMFAVICACLLVVVLISVWVISNKGKESSTNDGRETAIAVTPGDTIEFGTYNGVPIEWRVLRMSEDGKMAVVVSKYILTMKAFDAAESGKYNVNEGTDYWGTSIEKESEELQHLLRGNNEWQDSNIRTWLNSNRENVEYENGVPKAMAMSSLLNGYDSEAGFLTGFTEEEQEAICMTKVETNGVFSEDKVFLLSKDELKWFEEANISLMTGPTPEACEQDKADWYETYSLDFGVEDYFWWLRDAATENCYTAYMVCNSYSEENIKTESVGLEGYGIRPAMMIDVRTQCIRKK